MTASRIERERAYWNEARASGEATRAAIAKYYAVAGRRLDAYGAALEPYARRGAAMLELGCSDGATAVALADRGGRVTGIDISDVAIRRASARASSAGVEAGFAVGDAAALPFPDASFDVVYGSSVVHHVDIESVAAEAARVTRPGGAAVFLEPLGINPLIRLYRRLTPAARTVDERPLLACDLAEICGRWRQVRIGWFDLATLATVPLRGTPFFRHVLTAAQTIDDGLFSLLPSARRLAWFALIELADPVE